MATSIVSGRVDEDVRRRAAAYIEASGFTVADVIKNVWNAIAMTGEVPQPVEQSCIKERQAAKLAAFVAFSEALPPCSQATAAMDDHDMQTLIAGHHV